MNIQTLVACALLLILGFIYGSQRDVLRAHACAPNANSTATLHRTLALSPTQARYVFMSNDGCKLLVYAPRFPVLTRGTIAQIKGVQDTPERVFHSLPDYAEYLQNDGISLVVQNAEVVVRKQGDANIDSIRVESISRIATLFREPTASLLVAMLVGDQGMISKDIKDAYRNSGIIHILSISGLHVSIIAVMLTAGVGLLHVSPGVRSVLIFALLWIYVVGVGSPPSALRAGVFWTCYALAYHIRALVGLLTVVLLTLAVLLTHSPELAGSIGFQLSVTAVCGIGIALFFVRRLRLAPLVKSISTMIAVSAGATLATAPLTLYYFGNVALVGLITNLLVVPVLPFVTYVALIALFFQQIFYPIALLCSFIVHGLMSWVLLVARVCASIPYGHFENIHVPVWGIVVYYSLIGLLIVYSMKRLRISWRQWWI